MATFILTRAEGQDNETVQEAGKAVHDLSVALTENGYSPEAITQYEAALKLVPSRSPIAGTLLYGMSAIYLERNDHVKGLKSLSECLKVMENNRATDVLYAEALLLKGDALMANCDYEGSNGVL